MKTSFAKRLSVCLVAVIIAVVIASGAVVACKTSGLIGTKRGIVIVSALLSGGLYLENEDGTQTPFWDPIYNYDFPVQDVLNADGSLSLNISLDDPLVADVLKSIGGLGEALKLLDSKNGLFANLMVDPVTGKSVKNVSVANMDSDSRLKYGVVNVYKQTYDSMLAEYGDTAEVSVFCYDWRLDNRDNAKLLEDYINAKGYDEVVLTSHSMGGNVVSCYLARSEANRQKVVLYCPYAPSALGSIDALAYLEDASLIIEGMDFGDYTSLVGGIVGGVATDLLRSMVSMYELLPFPTLMTSGQYSHTGDDYMITVDGKPITTREELIAFYASRPFAKTNVGDSDNPDYQTVYAFQTEENGKTRLENYWDSSYVEVDGKLVHSTTLVNTVYFMGTDCDGRTRVQYVTDEKGDVVLDKVIRSAKGDNMVLEWSATCGVGPDAENVYTIEKGNHGPVGIKFDDLLKDKTFEEINKVWCATDL